MRTKSGYCVTLSIIISQNYDNLPPSPSAYKTKRMVEQKRDWVADSIDCINDNSFLVAKVKLNWSDLKKFIGKKNGDF